MKGTLFKRDIGSIYVEIFAPKIWFSSVTVHQ